MRRALVLLTLTPIAPAQLRLAVIPAPGQEISVNGAFEMGQIPSGDSLEARFRLRNIGTANVTLTRLGVGGTGFSIAGDTALPYLVTPGTNVDFFVRFRSDAPGGFGAILQYNDQSIVLHAQVTPAAAVFAEVNGTLIPLEGPLDFGRIERGATATRAVTLSNANTTPIEVATLSTGAPFGIRGIAAPLTLGPRESVAFEIVYTARLTGPERGTLRVDGRTFTLSGFGVDPPLPEPEIVFSTENAASAQQVRVSVRLSATARASGTGKLSFALIPLASGIVADATIQFLATAASEIDIAVAEGATAALIDDRADATFQTGTTAGTLVFTVRLGNHTRQALLRIPAAAPAIDVTRGSRLANALDVQLAGFDNTRTLSRLRFHFFDRGGATISSGPVDAEAGPEFRRFFETSPAGGVFGLRAVFPVAGDASQVAGVEVELTSGAGVTRTARIAF